MLNPVFETCTFLGNFIIHIEILQRPLHDIEGLNWLFSAYLVRFDYFCIFKSEVSNAYSAFIVIVNI